MKILVSYGFRSPYPPIGIFCSRAFKELGHKVFIFNSRIENPIYKRINKISKKFGFKIADIEHRAKVNILLVKTAFNFKPDIILDIGGNFLFPKTLKKVKDICKVKLVLWDTERYPGTIREIFIEESKFYDYIFSTSNYVVKVCKEKKVKNIFYLPLGTDTHFYRKLKLAKYDLKKYNCDIGFVGAHDKNRERILSNLTEFDLKIYGTEWDKTLSHNLDPFVKSKSGLYAKNTIKFYNATKINLNITKEKYVRYPSGMDLRLFDILSCRSFLITQYVEEIPSSFVVGQEIETFKEISELKDKIEFYLKNDDRRIEISQRGFARVCREHTILKRMQEMLSILK